MAEDTTNTEQNRVAADCPNEHVVMCRCGVNPATEPHPCPYAEEINDNDDPEFCTCCADCQHECAMDI